MASSERRLRCWSTLANPSLRFREAVVRVTTINPGPVIKALETEGYALKNPKRLTC